MSFLSFLKRKCGCEETARESYDKGYREGYDTAHPIGYEKGKRDIEWQKEYSEKLERDRKRHWDTQWAELEANQKKLREQVLEFENYKARELYNMIAGLFRR